MLQQPLASLRRTDAPAITVQQLDLQILLQASYETTEHGLTNRQGRCGTRETSGFDHMNEAMEWT